MLKRSTLTSLLALRQLLKNRLFSITWKHLCEPDICMWRPTLFFRIAFFPQEEAVPPWQASTQWHHCTYSVKYGWCDAHSPCVGGVICQEIPPGNYLLLFYALAGRCGLPFSTARVKIAQPPPWIWRAGATHQTEGALFFFFFCFFPRMSNPPRRNRATWQHQSHLIWYAVFQSTSAEALWASRAVAKRRGGRRGEKRKKEKHHLANRQSQAWNVDPVEQPFCRPFSCTPDTKGYWGVLFLAQVTQYKCQHNTELPFVLLFFVSQLQVHAAWVSFRYIASSFCWNERWANLINSIV